MRFETIENPASELQDALWNGLRQAARVAIQTPELREHHFFCILARQDAQLTGGLMATTYFGGMSLQCLWVHEDFRNAGLGKELLLRGEQAARQFNCSVIFGHSFGFQAPRFYQKAGYEIFGEIPDYPPGQICFFLRKYLNR
jgi:ribosomal protein S18 acetylase RimI-like enzyme